MSVETTIGLDDEQTTTTTEMTGNLANTSANLTTDNTKVVTVDSLAHSASESTFLEDMKTHLEDMLQNYWNHSLEMGNSGLDGNSAVSFGNETVAKDGMLDDMHQNVVWIVLLVIIGALTGTILKYK